MLPLALLLACTGPAKDTGPLDADGDGTSTPADCDDTDDTVGPGVDERCDGVDNNCDGAVDETGTDAPTWYPDADGDTYGSDAGSTVACVAPSGYLDEGGDCDDADAAIHPGAEETCDEVDQDCDGTVDDDATDAATWYRDTDGDGVGAEAVQACVGDGLAATGDDCDDGDASIHPGAPETDWDRVDSDCDGTAFALVPRALDVYAGTGLIGPAAVRYGDTVGIGWLSTTLDSGKTLVHSAGLLALVDPATLAAPLHRVWQFGDPLYDFEGRMDLFVAGDRAYWWFGFDYTSTDFAAMVGNSLVDPVATVQYGRFTTEGAMAEASAIERADGTVQLTLCSGTTDFVAGGIATSLTELETATVPLASTRGSTSPAGYTTCTWSGDTIVAADWAGGTLDTYTAADNALVYAGSAADVAPTDFAVVERDTGWYTAAAVGGVLQVTERTIDTDVVLDAHATALAATLVDIGVASDGTILAVGTGGDTISAARRSAAGGWEEFTLSQPYGPVDEVAGAFLGDDRFVLAWRTGDTLHYAVTGP